MKKFISAIISLSMIVFMLISLVSCNNKLQKKAVAPSKYKGKYLLNGFDTIDDLYKVRQLTLRTGTNAYSGYSAKGKLDIVTKENFLDGDAEKSNYKSEDLAPKQGKGALYIDYVSHQASKGGFTKITAMFKNSKIKDLPTEKIGQISVWVFNNNETEQKLTFGLIDSGTNIIEYGCDPFVLAPYSWTECKLALAPTITKYQAKKIAGVGLEFDNKQGKSYYIDELSISFEQKTTPEEKEYLKKVKKVESDIEHFLAENSVSPSVKNALENVFNEYIELPEAYRALVSNYSSLKDFINQYLKLVSDNQMLLNGTSTLVYYDQVFGLSQIERCVGAKATYTKAEHAPGEEGSTCFTFDGTMDWIELLDVPVAESYDEVRIWVKNDSPNARAMLLYWTSLLKTGGKVYDVNGNEISNNFIDGVDRNNNVIGTNEWVQLVFNQAVAVTNINLCSFDRETTNTTLSTGKLYIGKILGVSKGAALLDKIDALMKKTSFASQDYIDIFDIYMAISSMSPDQQAVLGEKRVSFINDFYKKNKERIISEKISGIKISSEYNASQIREILELEKIYNALTSKEKAKISRSHLDSLLKSINGYDKNGILMDVTQYKNDYEQELFFSTKEKLSGNSSVKVSRVFTDKSSVTYVFPQMISNAKKIRITMKNVSSEGIAFFLDGSGPQGAKWLEPSNTGYILQPDDGYKEFVYDVQGYDITGMIFTLGPWKNGNMNVYIDSIDVIYDIATDVSKQVKKLSSLANQNEFSTLQVKKIEELYEQYKKLSSANKKKVDAELLTNLYAKISKHNKNSVYMDAALYGEEVQNNVFHSNKEKYGANSFALKLEKNIQNKAEAVFKLPENIIGKELKITVKNASKDNVAFYVRASKNNKEEWLVPINTSYMLNGNSSWITLIYDISDYSADAVIATVGPWKNGDLRLYIGDIEILKTNFDVVKSGLKTLNALSDKTEFSASEINSILKTHNAYTQLSKKDKDALNVTVLNSLMNKIKYYDASDLLNVLKYEQKYDSALKYSLKEKNKSSDYSVRYSVMSEGAEDYLFLPKTISKAAQLKVTLKNVSEKQIAFWVKQTESQGNTWLEPVSSSCFVDNNGEYITLTYDIQGKEIDALVFTIGPWESGEIDVYVSDIEVLSAFEQVKEAVDDCKKIFRNKTLNAGDINSIISALTLYEEKLTLAEQQAIDVSDLLDILKKTDDISSSAPFADITLFKNEYLDNLLYSFEDSNLNNNDMSLIIKAETSSSEKEIFFPESIENNKYLSVILKNNSDADVAFWIKAVKDGKELWLTPTNHNANPVISAGEGFVDLQYNIEGCDLKAFECSYGPWKSGDFEVCISDIKMFDSYLDIVKSELEKCDKSLENKTLSATDVIILNNALNIYNTLTLQEKNQLDISNISAILADIELFKSKSSNFDLSKYAFDCSENLFYSYEDTALANESQIELKIKSAKKEFVLKLNASYKDSVTLKITLKNPSDEDLSFYLQDIDGERIKPVNHEKSPIIKKSEGYVTLEYDISKTEISKFVFCNATGDIETYIDNIECAYSNYEQLKVSSFTGGTFTENGGIYQFVCNGVTNWSDINFDAVSHSADEETHLFVKNDSDLNRAIYLNWAMPVRVYDQNGKLYNGISTYIIPNDNKVYELVFDNPLSANQINITSLNGANNPTISTGSLVILGYSVKEKGTDYLPLSVSKMTGGTYLSNKTETTFTFNETAGWCDIDFSQIAFANELHIFVKNNSEYRRMFDLDWKSPDKVLNQKGEDVTGSITNILPANDDTVYEFVYYNTKSPCKQINCTSLNDKNASIASKGSLTVLGYTVK